MSSEFLNDAFNNYFDKGIAAKSAGNIPEAKRLLLLAAGTLRKIADESTGELKISRQKRVLNILEIVENFGNPQKSAKQKASGGDDDVREIEEDWGEILQKEERDPSLTVWKSVEIPDETLDGSIAGLEDVKKAARKMIINVIKYGELYKKHNRDGGGGILMCGLPGNGKTAIARAIAGEAGCKFFAVRSSDIKSKWQGIAVRNIKNLFATARKEKRAIIFFDEFDSLGVSRDLAGDDIVAKEVLNEILSQMDGFEKHKCMLLVLAATNLPWLLDPAVHSRFKLTLEVPMPDFDARKFIINREIKNSPQASGFDIAEIAYRTEGYSGRDIVSLCEMAKGLPLERDIENAQKGLPAVAVLCNADFDEALRSVKSTVREKDKVRMEQYLSEHK